MSTPATLETPDTKLVRFSFVPMARKKALVGSCESLTNVIFGVLTNAADVDGLFLPQPTACAG